MKHLKTYNESVRDLMTPKSNEDIIKVLKLDNRIKEVLLSKGFKYINFNDIADFKNNYSDFVEKTRYFFKKDDAIAVVQTTDDVETVIKYLNYF